MLTTPPDPGDPRPLTPRGPTRVRFTPTAQCDAGAGPGVARDLAFTSTNWNVAQQVQITAFQDPFVELLHECEFIVVSRPSYSLGDAARALPKALRPPEAVLKELSKQQVGTIELPGAAIHRLDGVWESVSSTEIRAAARKSANSAYLILT